MPFDFGWLSTGRDEAARQLLMAAGKWMQAGFIAGQIDFVFCDRERGEGEESDLFLDLAAELGLKTITFSSRSFRPELRLANRDQWRKEYHRSVIEKISPYKNALLVLAGYMLIASPEMCRRFTMINLHPALPGGPTGTWEEVIERLIRDRAGITGAMMHLVTPELDQGPAITYYSFPIQGGAFAALWGAGPTEHGPLFWKIRQEGVRREIPLIVLTLKAVAEGRLRIKDGKVADGTGKEIQPLSLTGEVEEYLRQLTH
jgi:phosphoribosylglycinamide formyltransferase-1